MGKRTKARECAFQMLYQWDMTKEPMDEVARSYWRVRTTTDETRARAERLAFGAVQEQARIDEAIQVAATNWRLARIAAVDRNILRIATFELMMDADTPSAVVLDEAVEMAKRFSEADAPSFVNGVLDAIMRRVRPAVRPNAAEGDTRP